MSLSTKSPDTGKLPKLIARRNSGCLVCSLHAVTRKVKNHVLFWSSTPNNLVFLPVGRMTASAHNGILRVACNPECPDQQQLLLSQERFNMTISVKAEMHVMICTRPANSLRPRPHPSHTRTTKILIQDMQSHHYVPNIHTQSMSLRHNNAIL